MRIVCPSCQAAYDVPATVLQAGRTLRCARCSADFIPAAAADPSTPPPRAAPETAPGPAPLVSERLILPAAAAKPGQRRGGRVAVMAGWAASLAVLAAMGWSFVFWRAPIAHAWPASERVYSALGFK